MNPIYNLTITSNDFKQVCEINQIDMLNQLQKQPQQIFIFLAICCILLLLYMFWFRETQQEFIKKHIEPNIHFWIFIILIFATFLQLINTYEINYKSFELIMSIIVGIGIIYIIITEIQKRNRND